MYERFTDRARKVMQLANQEAQRLSHEYIGTEHILLGLVKERTGVAGTVLTNLGVSLDTIYAKVEKIVQAGPDVVTLGTLPQTPRGRKVVEYALEESRNLNHNYVGTEHLLLGLLRVSDADAEHGADSVAAHVLLGMGLSLQVIRAEILRLLGIDTSAPTCERDPDSPPMVLSMRLVEWSDVTSLFGMMPVKSTAPANGCIGMLLVFRDEASAKAEFPNHQTVEVQRA